MLILYYKKDNSFYLRYLFRHRIVFKGRCIDNEDDISAKKEIQSKSSWIQSKNENSRRKKSIGCQKSKRKKAIISLGRIYCGLFFYNYGVLGVKECPENKLRGNICYILNL